ncbi:hypothetical protein SSP35_02_02370 [Streptomyces sp. NBRC 110611]|uniref:DUF2079 domain-containing protein n=1 Tax=Streptomyces sp. NBRC 110611 TaxID=1621259 RepID=UPI000831F07A|nr:DUF2079 domain-containing protein [Streptomyces sp. NBRC 110611]GAU65870.1 hypothetical protein SSP35_02_02370 [Streptomyces sp. NBRC 110611]
MSSLAPSRSRPRPRPFAVLMPPRGGDVQQRRASRPRLLAVLFFAVYAALSVTKHLQLRSTGYDLGIFEQAIRAYAQLRAPVSELKGAGYHLLGDHFHPILATLAPLYRLFPTPLTLLTAQAALIALSVIPVTRLAIRTTTPRLGTAIGIAYGLSWGLQKAIAFDFHEIAFAVPLLAFCLERLAVRHRRAAALWALPLVLVKEDLPLTVTAIGLYILLCGRRRVGTAVVAYGVLSGLLIVLVVIPAFNPDGQYAYLHTATEAAGNPLTRLLLPPQKLGTLIVLLAPTVFLALRSPLVLLALPTVAWRFWSTNPAYWGLDYHYSAVLMPIVFLAFADALGRLNRRPRLVTRAVAASVAGSVLALPFLPLRDLAGPAWRPSPWSGAAREVMAAVPDGAEIGAVNYLAPQLTSRARVYRFPQVLDSGTAPEWLLISDPARGGMPGFAEELPRLPEIPSRGYRLVIERSGIQLYRLADR